MIPDQNRFESDPDAALGPVVGLPPGWSVGSPDAADRFDVARLARLLRDHERHGRGWAGAGVDDVLVEVSEHGLRMRENVVVRDADGEIQAWGSVHDRSVGRMLFVHVVARDLPDDIADRCAELLVEWARAQARAVGAARGLTTQQIDTGAFQGDERQARWLRESGFERVRTWWQMSRPVVPAELGLVPDPAHWEKDGVVIRLVRHGDGGLPDEDDLRRMHDVLEGAFVDHFNSSEETFEEFLHRLREDPGHRWDHWWLAELVDGPEPVPVGALVGTVSETRGGPDGSYVSYLGVLSAARGRGVAKGLLRTIVADAALRERDRVGLEVDADSPTGAAGLYTSMGWATKYVTESWHRDVPVA
ncbi:GNAT family N-acetyltransferase [Nocardioides sp. LMS-CY]|uniref:Ribosomal protein S18 acetylase RimI-like enzyme n=1 Tax=Nocardioides soli TaxID=1036020 RepID=A0A7W4Z2C6_9ACTN|nr:GNAT family N-acetyltransferase [Nocardioides sp. LMS-CY]MBB3042736.1 ribosomal protein S18 acetylase RimI-like enzyme [Nocardioides soli]QWF22849.1 GNAT family N-acetyltransferase [Nocardioides sp. LMS-CY]